jgi:hypothetical protein
MAGFRAFGSRSAWLTSLAALVGGMIVGAVVSYGAALGLPAMSDFSNYFGLWIALAAPIAAWSRTWQRAVAYVVLFLLGMVVAYYVATLLIFGYFLRNLVLGWSAVTLLFAPPFAVLVWQARRDGWSGALGVALPVGLLLYEAYSLRWVLQIHAAQFIFNLLAAAVLLAILPGSPSRRVRAVALTPAVVIGASLVLEYAVRVAGRFI